MVNALARRRKDRAQLEHHNLTQRGTHVETNDPNDAEGFGIAELRGFHDHGGSRL
jgi:hypothetical protein